MGRAANRSPAPQSGPPGFNPTSVEVGFVVNKMAQVEVLLQVLRYSPVSIILSMFHSNLFFAATKTVQLEAYLNNTVTIHLLWMMLTALHNEGRNNGLIFHGVCHLFL